MVAAPGARRAGERICRVGFEAEDAALANATTDSCLSSCAGRGSYASLETGGLAHDQMQDVPQPVLRIGLGDGDIRCAQFLVMIASDGRIEQRKGHPRSAGTYACPSHYVREEKALPLMAAIQKMTLLPARRLESVSPQMARRGRIKVGTDADITVFDPAHVVDMATFGKPDQYSEGIPFVLVNGVFVVRDGKVVEGVNPGVGIKSH
jgi:hypothetical protein